MIVRHGPAEAVHHAAHRLKGAIALFGTSRLVDPIEELEDRARRGDVEDAERLTAELRAAVALVLVGVDDLVARGAVSTFDDETRAADLEEVTH